MKREWVLFIFVSVFCFTGCASVKNNDLALRRAFLDNSINAIDEINPDIAGVNDISKKLRQILYIGKIEELNTEAGYFGAELLEASKDPQFEKKFVDSKCTNNYEGPYSVMALIILAKDEIKIGSVFGSEMEAGAGSLFIPGYNPPMLVIEEGKFSRFWTGIAMLYPGYYVISFLKCPSNYLEKNAVFGWVFDILEKRGGKNYNRVLHEKTALMKEQLLKNGKSLKIDYADAYELDNAFEEPPFSEGERKLRWITLWSHSIFLAEQAVN